MYNNNKKSIRNISNLEIKKRKSETSYKKLTFHQTQGTTDSKYFLRNLISLKQFKTNILFLNSKTLIKLITKKKNQTIQDIWYLRYKLPSCNLYIYNEEKCIYLFFNHVKSFVDGHRLPFFFFKFPIHFPILFLINFHPYISRP